MEQSDLHQKPTFSFEFFPTKANQSVLYDTIAKYQGFSPEYVSITYGAGGSTRDQTQECVRYVQDSLNMCVVAHLTCVNHSVAEVRAILDYYQAHNVTHILALRGDIPQDVPLIEQPAFKYAKELVTYIRQHFPQFKIGVAGFPEGHPQTQNRLKELTYLAEKVEAGADYICTQLFFDNRDFYDFIERCSTVGIDTPIIPGLMPITSKKNLNRMAELAAGSRYPAKLLAAIQNAKDDAEIMEIGIKWTTNQVKDLIQKGHSHIHFYTLNQFEPIARIIDQL